MLNSRGKYTAYHPRDARAKLEYAARCTYDTVLEKDVVR
jgi:hypothetical protein